MTTYEPSWTAILAFPIALIIVVLNLNTIINVIGDVFEAVGMDRHSEAWHISQKFCQDKGYDYGQLTATNTYNVRCFKNDSIEGTAFIVNLDERSG